MSTLRSIVDYMDGLILKIGGLALILISIVFYYLFMDWRGLSLSFLSFFVGAMMIFYSFKPFKDTVSKSSS